MKKRSLTERQWTHVKQGFNLPNECLDVTKKPVQHIRIIIEQVSSPVGSPVGSPVKRSNRSESGNKDRRNSANARSGSGNMEDDSIFHSPRNNDVSRGEPLDNSGLGASNLP